MAERTGGRADEESRRFPRYRISLPVRLYLKRASTELLTSEVSRHGIFLRSDNPSPLRQLVQLAITLPDSRTIELMGMVARIVKPGEAASSGPGMGIDFFAMSAAAKTHWSEFIFRLRQEALAQEQAIADDEVIDAEAVPDESPSGTAPAAADAAGEAASARGGAPAFPRATGMGVAGTGLLIDPELAEIPGIAEIFDEIPEAVIIPDGRDEEVPPALIVAEGDEDLPPEPVRRRAPRYTATFHVRLKDQDLLKTFYTTDISTGGMFLKTPLLKKVGDRIELYLVHPDSDQEFKLAGRVVRVVTAAPVNEQGLGIELEPLGEDRQWSLVNFIETGVGAFAPDQTPEEQWIEVLRSAVALAPDSPRARVALADRLLEDQEDAPGAIAEYTAALAADPDCLPAHRGLQIAYGMLGDAEQVALHLREIKRIRRERPEEPDEI